jgi:hypothetical protein
VALYTNNNSADIATRSQSNAKIINNRWLHGTESLGHLHEIPYENFELIERDSDCEILKKQV